MAAASPQHDPDQTTWWLKLIPPVAGILSTAWGLFGKRRSGPDPEIRTLRDELIAYERQCDARFLAAEKEANQRDIALREEIASRFELLTELVKARRSGT